VSERAVSQRGFSVAQHEDFAQNCHVERSGNSDLLIEIGENFDNAAANR
jgi:hypothetical protein